MLSTASIQASLRWLLGPGGIGAAYLVQNGMDPGTVTNVLTVALITVPWLVQWILTLMAHTDKATLIAASKIVGPAGTIVVPPTASAGALAAAASPTLQNIVASPSASPVQV